VSICRLLCRPRGLSIAAACMLVCIYAHAHAVLFLDHNDHGACRSQSYLVSLFKGSAGASAAGTSPPPAMEAAPEATKIDAAVAALFADAPFASKPHKTQQPEQPACEPPPDPGAQTPIARTDAAAPPQLRTADDYVRRLAPLLAGPAMPAATVSGLDFVRQEPLEVLEAKLKAARPALMADFRSKQRTVRKKAKAAGGERR
jgi:hypothetical protein